MLYAYKCEHNYTIGEVLIWSLVIEICVIRIFISATCFNVQIEFLSIVESPNHKLLSIQVYIGRLKIGLSHLQNVSRYNIHAHACKRKSPLLNSDTDSLMVAKVTIKRWKNPKIAYFLLCSRVPVPFRTCLTTSMLFSSFNHVGNGWVFFSAAYVGSDGSERKMNRTF